MPTRQLVLPHRPAHALCIVNGIRDLIEWKTGRNWSNAFVYGLGQGSSFAYIKVKTAIPPRQVYWGISTPRQHEYLARLLGANLTLSENRTFSFAWNKACASVEAGVPPILGPLDMYYLPYYEHIYRKRHIPIHYVLLVGYDGRNAYVHDTDKDDVQGIPLNELEAAWNVVSPGLGKKNRLAILDIPEKIPPDADLVRMSIAEKCRTMLQPPVSILGVPGMKKLAREIPGWREELGGELTAACLLQVREYLNTPPDLSGDHLTATHDLYIAFLQEAGKSSGMDFNGPIAFLQDSMAFIPGLAHAVRASLLKEAAELVRRMADFETVAYTELRKLVS
jgi:hypothetical protein